MRILRTRTVLFSLVLALAVSERAALIGTAAQAPRADAPAAVQATSKASAAALAAIDKTLDDLNDFVGGYPPQFASEAEKRATETKLRDVLKSAADLLAKHPTDAEVEIRLGVGYTYAHNLDWDGAWNQAEAHLKKAILLDPSSVEAHMALGRLLVNTSVALAPAAEKEFLTALELSGATPRAGAYSGLTFAYYYQARFRAALESADKYLLLRPGDEVMMKMRDIIRDKVKEAGQ